MDSPSVKVTVSWWVWVYLAEQLDIEDASCVKHYPERRGTPYEHAQEIRQRFRYRDFTDRKWGREFRGFLYGRAWTHAEGPVALFNHAVTWLRKNRVAPGPDQGQGYNAMGVIPLPRR
ncbi:DUF4158 domain-containing protein [Streptomyces asiaticus]|uniref:DUF4158 domain-containing protein n=1 Tax=Streptomyces asiaticus TaxID=114695 RepID=UPI003F66BB8E